MLLFVPYDTNDKAAPLMHMSQHAATEHLLGVAERVIFEGSGPRNCGSAYRRVAHPRWTNGLLGYEAEESDDVREF